MLQPFEYHGPSSRKEVTKLLLELDEAKLLAGGTDLIVDMRAGVLRPRHVIDLKRVEGLDELAVAAGKGCFIGACVRLASVADDGSLPWDCLKEAVRSIATCQIRNIATAVGNICNASPAADCAPPLLALGASLKVMEENGGERSVPLRDFFAGVKKNALERGQWVMGIDVPPQPSDLRSAFMKRQRIRGHDLALANAAGCLSRDAGTLRIAVGACAATPLLFDLDELYEEKRSTGSLTEAVVELVCKGISPIDDVRCCGDYRTEMVRLMVGRIMERIQA